MKLFLKRILIFLIPVIILAYPIDLVLSYFLKKTHEYAGEIEVWNDIYNGNVNSEILIYGSSRAWTHIDPIILKDSLKMSAYNFGMDGNIFQMQYLRHTEYIKNNRKPSCIIISLDIFSLEKPGNFFNKNQLLPFMLWNKEIEKHVSDFKGYTWCDYNVPLLRYCFNQKAIVHSALSIFSSKKTRNFGFMAKDLKWDGKFEKVKKEMSNYAAYVDSSSLKLFEQFIRECRNDNISLVFVYSPEYIEGQGFIKNRKEVLDVYQSLASKYQIPYFDYSKKQICLEKEYFYNTTHLNKKGAELFSRLLAKDLKTILSQKDLLVAY